MSTEVGIPYERRQPSPELRAFLDPLNPGNYFDCGEARLFGIDEVLELEAKKRGRPLGADSFQLIATDGGLIFCRASITFAIAARWKDLSIARPTRKANSDLIEMPITWPTHGELNFTVSRRLASNLFRHWLYLQSQATRRRQAEQQARFEQTQRGSTTGEGPDDVSRDSLPAFETEPATAGKTVQISEADREAIRQLMLQSPEYRKKDPVELLGKVSHDPVSVEGADAEQEVDDVLDLGQSDSSESTPQEPRPLDDWPVPVFVTRPEEFLVRRSDRLAPTEVFPDSVAPSINEASEDLVSSADTAADAVVGLAVVPAVDGGTSTNYLAGLADPQSSQAESPRIHRAPIPEIRGARLRAPLSAEERRRYAESVADQGAASDPDRHRLAVDQPADALKSEKAPLERETPTLSEQWRRHRISALATVSVVALVAVAISSLVGGRDATASNGVASEAADTTQTATAESDNIADQVQEPAVRSDTPDPAAGSVSTADPSLAQRSASTSSSDSSPQQQSSNEILICHSNYGGCVAVAADVDCEGDGDGPAFLSEPVVVFGEDVYNIDTDGDREACEPGQPLASDSQDTDATSDSSSE